MALSAETSSWLEDLKKNGGIADEDYARLKATFENSKADEYVRGSVLRQSDYSRQSAEIQKAQKDLETSTNALKDREAAVTKFQGELATWQTGAKENYDKALKAREAAEVKANAALARLKTLAVANGLSEDDVLKDLEVTSVVEKKTDPQFDTSGFIRKEDLAKGIAESALVDATIHDVAMEYMELTGKPLKGAADLVKEAIQSGKSIQQYAEEKFKFVDLRKARDEAAYQERLKKDVDAEVSKRLSEAQIPGNPGGMRTDLHGSPVLLKDGIKMPEKDTQSGGGVSAAVAAFQSGKYKQ